MSSEQPNNPLHGLTLAKIVTRLVEHFGWDELAQIIDINCFKSDPSIKSSLNFLRKTQWARGKVEDLYISTFSRQAHMKILLVLTSHSQLGDTGQKTGFWLEEFVTPYYIFKDAKAEVILASPDGGQPPLDPKSDEPDFQTEATERFKRDDDAQAALANTLKLSDISPDSYDAVFYAGGHGPLWDLAEDRDSIALIETMYASGKPVAAVCHAPAVLRHSKAPDGSPLIRGKSVTGFSNTEEEAVQLSGVVPFLLEDELKAKGANYSKADDWHPHTITDGNLITGQNPASSDPVAKAVLERIKQ